MVRAVAIAAAVGSAIVLSGCVGGPGGTPTAVYSCTTPNGPVRLTIYEDGVASAQVWSGAVVSLTLAEDGFYRGRWRTEGAPPGGGVDYGIRPTSPARQQVGIGNNSPIQCTAA